MVENGFCFGSFCHLLLKKPNILVFGRLDINVNFSNQNYDGDFLKKPSAFDNRKNYITQQTTFI